MFLSKLNSLFKKYNKIIFLILTIIIVVPFVFFSSSENFYNVIYSFFYNDNKNNTTNILKINNMPINQNEINYNIKCNLLEKELFKNHPTYIIKYKIHKIENRILLLKEAKILNIKPMKTKSNIMMEKLKEFIITTKYYDNTNTNNNIFIEGKYYKLINNIKNEYQISNEELLKFFEDTSIIISLQEKIINNSEIAYEEVENIYNKKEAIYHIKEFICDNKKFIQKITYNNEDIKQFFNNNKTNYIFNEKSKVIIAESNYLNYIDYAKSINKNKTTDEIIIIAKNIAMEKAQKFAVAAYNNIFDDSNFRKIDSQNIFKNDAKKNNFNIFITRKWLNEKNKYIDPIGYRPELSIEISKLQIDNPISNVINIDEIGKYYVIYLTEREMVNDINNINLIDVIKEVEDDFKFTINKNIMKKHTYKLFNEILQSKINNTINIDQNIFNDIFNNKKITFKELIKSYNLSKTNNIDKKLIKEKELIYIYEENDKFIIRFLYKIQYPDKKIFTKIYKKYEKLIKWSRYISFTKNKYNIINNINI